MNFASLKNMFSPHPPSVNSGMYSHPAVIEKTTMTSVNKKIKSKFFFISAELKSSLCGIILSRVLLLNRLEFHYK